MDTATVSYEEEDHITSYIVLMFGNMS